MLVSALSMLQEGFSEQTTSVQADMVALGRLGAARVQLDGQIAKMPPGAQSGEGRYLGNPIPSHPILYQLTHLSIRIASVLRSFSSHVSFSSAMIFSVSWQVRGEHVLRAADLPVLPAAAQHAAAGHWLQFQAGLNELQ